MDRIQASCQEHRKNSRIVLGLAMLLALTTTYVQAEPRTPTKAEIGAIEKAVKAKLKDGDSAKFAEIKIGKAGNSAAVACGVVNGKNSYGAYIGYQAFMVQLDSSEAWVRELDNAMNYPQAKADCHIIGIDLKLAAE